MQRWWVSVCFCGAFAIGAAASPEIGVGIADITPHVQQYRVPTAGYGARFGKPSTGVHDPLHASRQSSTV